MAGQEPSSERIAQILAASSDEYWNAIVAEIEASGKEVRHAWLLNHQASHLLFWATLARNAAKERAALDVVEQYGSQILANMSPEDQAEVKTLLDGTTSWTDLINVLDEIENRRKKVDKSDRNTI